MAKRKKKKKQEKEKKEEQVIILPDVKVKMDLWEIPVALVAVFFFVISLICAGMALRSLILSGDMSARRSAAVQTTAENEAPAILLEEPVAAPEEDAAESEAPSPSAGISTGLTAPGAQDWTVMVWVTDGGRTYHSRNDCEDIGSGSPREMMIQEAVALSYFRCEYCW